MFKVIFSSVLLALLSVTSVSAESRQVDDSKLMELMERREQAMERLNLSAEQRTAIEPILEESRGRQLDVLEKYGFGSGNKPKLSLRKKLSLAKEMKKVRKDTNAALSRHLTDDQLKEFKKIQEENREQMQAMLKSR